MGYHLQCKGTISREKLHACLETGQITEKALGKVLVEKNYIINEVQKIIMSVINNPDDKENGIEKSGGLLSKFKKG